MRIQKRLKCFYIPRERCQSGGWCSRRSPGDQLGTASQSLWSRGGRGWGWSIGQFPPSSALVACRPSGKQTGSYPFLPELTTQFLHMTWNEETQRELHSFCHSHSL